MRCGRGVNGRPPTAACKGACVYKNACRQRIFPFANSCIFVHVCRRCQRADRAGGIHVGLIFCNFSIKRKVKDYNCLIDLYLPQCATSSLCMTLSNKEFLSSQSYLCHHVYNYHKKNGHPKMSIFLRSLPDSNWSQRFCRPVPNHSAKRPSL